MPERFITRIEMTKATHTGMEHVCNRLGMTKVAAMSRMVEWLADQPQSIQSAVLGRYPEDLAPVIADMLLKHASGKSARSKH